LNESVDRLLDLIFNTTKNSKTVYHYDAEAHHQLAKKIAVNSAVLLKNEGGILPIPKGKKVALIGALAKEPRYQGTGSSHITPTKISSVLDGFNALGLDYTYYPGYPLKGRGDGSLLAEAVAGAQQCDIVVIFAGLPEEYESDGFDRDSLAMPESHNTLITKVAEANPSTVVLLAGGAPVEMPWLEKIKAVLNLYLAGQAIGLAVAELLAGAVNPSGKLAESYPLCYEDVPSEGFYESGGKQAQYREGIYIGYRYYDKARKAVLFPFGHGLSYTTFEYSNLEISSSELQAPYELKISLTLRNTGRVDGAEVVQVYVGAVGPTVYRPEKELREFMKVFLKAGESKLINFTLNARAFAVFAAETSSWIVPGGFYEILVGASSRDIRLKGRLNIQGQTIRAQPRQISDWYFNPSGKATQADFESLLGRKIEPVKVWHKGEYTLECSFNDMKDSFIVRQIMKSIENTIAKDFGGVDYSNPTFRMIMSSTTNTPLKNLSLLSPVRMPRNVTAGIIHLANGRYLLGILALMKKSKY